MRITVGGVLIICGICGAGYVGLTQTEYGKGYLNKIGPFSDQLKSNFDLLRQARFSEMSFSAKPQNLPPAQPEQKQNEAAPPVEQSPAESPAPEASPQEIIPPVVEKKPAPAHRKKRNKKAKPKAVAVPLIKTETKAPAPAAPKKAAAVESASSANYEKFIGAYVTLKLTTGTEVKGILKEITATDYKVELPGLGDFPYVHSKVKSIELAN